LLLAKGARFHEHRWSLNLLGIDWLVVDRETSEESSRDELDEDTPNELTCTNCDAD